MAVLPSMPPDEQLLSGTVSDLAVLQCRNRFSINCVDNLHICIDRHITHRSHRCTSLPSTPRVRP